MNNIELIGEPLYQWDTDRSVEVTLDPSCSIDEVHACSTGTTSAYNLEIVTDDNHVTAPIPNVLLQKDVGIRVFGVMRTAAGRRTVVERTFSVTPRAKPDDYVYTETEVKSYYSLDQRLRALEENGGPGEPGEDGGYYIPSISQVDENTMNVSFAASKEGMTAVPDQEITLPSGKDGTNGLPGADGKPGTDGITPHIGDNGNWFIGETDTGMPSRGEAGADDLLFDKTAGMLYLMYQGQIVGKGVQLEITGSSNNNAVLTLENTTGWENKTIAQDSRCTISFEWSSLEDGVSTGPGTVMVKVRGVLQYSAMVTQGEGLVNISDYLSLGYNIVNVTVFDIYNNSQKITLAVNVYDPDALKATKLVERTLSGDYTNDRITMAGANAFNGCNGITVLNLPSVTTFGAAAFKGINRLRLESLTDVGNNQFLYWNTNKVFDFPNVTTVGRSAFADCHATTTIKLMSAVSIDHLAFDYCKALTALVLSNRDEVCTLASITISNGPCPIKSGTGYIYVPFALVAGYQTATNWSAYANQFRALEDYTVDGTITGELDETKI